jgi:hypothetical protein
MWALLDKKTQIVIGGLMPDASEENIKEAEKHYDLIPMTLENSPATIGYKYSNNKFYRVEGETNG